MDDIDKIKNHPMTLITLGVISGSIEPLTYEQVYNIVCAIQDARTEKRPRGHEFAAIMSVLHEGSLINKTASYAFHMDAYAAAFDRGAA